MTKRTILLSIRPEFADLIFDHTKRVELRRIRPNLRSGDLVVVYVTAPVKAITGLFEVGGVLTDEPKSLWRKVKDSAGITHTQFAQYYDGAPMGYGILCRNPKRLDQPLGLSQLREQWKRFWPPQIYRYLSDDEISLIASYGDLGGTFTNHRSEQFSGSPKCVGGVSGGPPSPSQVSLGSNANL